MQSTSIWLLLTQWLASTTLAAISVHDGSFVPDHVIRVGLDNIPVACEMRSSVVINGSSPGPPIHILPGDSSWIRVYNDLPGMNLTMHWHGLAQRMAPFADGSPLASQWPIPAGHFFDYEVQTQLDDSGTYFYHSHVGMQALSAYGALIVDDCGSAPYEYDDERILQFGDYFAASDDNLAGGLTAVPFRWTGETMGVLLNGLGIGVNHTSVIGPKGGFRGMLGAGHGSHPGRPGGGTYPSLGSSSGSNSWSGSGSSPWTGNGNGWGQHSKRQSQVDPNTACTLPVIDVDPGKTYRFRMIGGTGLSFLTMALEGHGNFTIVQVDGGEYNKPVSVNHMQLGSGQRFDVLFKAKTAAELAANNNKTTYFLQFETRDRPTNYTGYAVIRYDKNTAVPTAPSKPIFTNLPNQMGSWLEYALTPLYPADNRAPTAAQVTRRIIIDCVQRLDNNRTGATGQTIWELAHLAWTEHSVSTPALVDIYQRGDAAVPDYNVALKNYGWDPKTLSFPALMGEVLEIVLQNTGSLLPPGGGVDSHPFHAHGQHVYDLGSGDGQYDLQKNEEKIKRLGYVPVRRDTTMLHRYTSMTTPGAAAGWRVWRIRIEQPGVWMIHCHTLAHMIMGMQSVWVVGNAAQIRQIPPEESKGYFVYGGNVLGNDTSDPVLYEYFNGSTGQCRAVAATDAGSSGGTQERRRSVPLLA